jgi:hypothetical protein
LSHTAPETGRGRRGDGDTALLFLLHPVHGGGAIMDLSDLVGDTGVEEHTLGGSRFTGIDMRHDANITIALDWSFPCHVTNLFVKELELG